MNIENILGGGYGDYREGAAIAIKSLSEARESVVIGKVTLLGHNGKLRWFRDAAVLKVRLAPEKPCDYARAPVNGHEGDQRI